MPAHNWVAVYEDGSIQAMVAWGLDANGQMRGLVTNGGRQYAVDVDPSFSHFAYLDTNGIGDFVSEDGEIADELDDDGDLV
jgi:hypothetical protein